MMRRKWGHGRRFRNVTRTELICGRAASKTACTAQCSMFGGHGVACTDGTCNTALQSSTWLTGCSASWQHEYSSHAKPTLP
jgi:hypothetical protein